MEIEVPSGSMATLPDHHDDDVGRRAPSRLFLLIPCIAALMGVALILVGWHAIPAAWYAGAVDTDAKEKFSPGVLGTLLEALAGFTLGFVVSRRRGWQGDTTLWVSGGSAALAAIITGLVLKATVFAHPWGQ